MLSTAFLLRRMVGLARRWLRGRFLWRRDVTIVTGYELLRKYEVIGRVMLSDRDIHVLDGGDDEFENMYEYHF